MQAAATFLAPSALRSQAAICIGYATPLFIAYLFEARRKLRFARQQGLLQREAQTDNGSAISFVGCVVDDAFVSALAYFNLMSMCNAMVVAGVTYVHGR